MASDGSVERIDRRLDSAWHKVEHAKLHIETLKGECLRTLKGDGEPLMALRHKFHFNGSYYSSEIEWIRAIPPAIPLRIGDVIHNLRGALEHVAWQLALDNGAFAIAVWRKQTAAGKPFALRPQFTIADSKADFDRLAASQLTPIHATHRAMIERVQPYEGWCASLPSGKQPLTLLRDLSNTDKHKEITTATVGSGAMSHDVVTSHNVIVREIRPNPDLVGKPLEAGAELVRVYVESTGPDPDVHVQSKGTACVAFDDGSEVVEALTGIAACVARIVGEFEPVFQPPWWEGP